LLVACALLLALDLVVLGTRGGDTAANHAAVRTASTSTTAPPPPAVLVGRKNGDEPAQVLVVLGDGSPAATSTASGAAVDTVRGNRKVFSKVISSSGGPFSGCGIAGCSSGYSSSTQAGIALADLDGAHEQLLSQGGYDSQPVFTPDGRSIAYLRHQRAADPYPNDVIDAVTIMSLTGKIRYLFAPAPTWTYRSFAVSPTGDAVAALRVSLSQPADVAGAAQVVLLGLRGQPERQIAAGNFRELSWSHDGQHIAALRTHYVQYGRPVKPYQPGDHSTGDDIWILSIDASPPLQLTHTAPANELPDSAFCWNGYRIEHARPRWSPNDQQLAFTAHGAIIDTSGRNFDVAVADVATGAVRLVFQAPRELCSREVVNVAPMPSTEVYGWTN
jgi:Tol biopolymer transport system component